MPQEKDGWYDDDNINFNDDDDDSNFNDDDDDE